MASGTKILPVVMLLPISFKIVDFCISVFLTTGGTGERVGLEDNL